MTWWFEVLKVKQKILAPYWSRQELGRSINQPVEPELIDYRIKDYDLFKKRVRELFNEVSAQSFHGIDPITGERRDFMRETGPRKAYVRMSESKTYPTGDLIDLNYSIRNPYDESRDSYTFKVRPHSANPDLMILVNVLGKNIHIEADDIINNEEDLFSKIEWAVKTDFSQKDFKTTKIKKPRNFNAWLTDRTEKQIKEELEEANEGFTYQDGQMIRDEIWDEATRNPIQGMTIGDYMRDFGWSLREEDS